MENKQQKKKADSRNAKRKVFFRLRQQITKLCLHKNWPTSCHLLGLEVHCKGTGEPGCHPFSVDEESQTQGASHGNQPWFSNL